MNIYDEPIILDYRDTVEYKRQAGNVLRFAIGIRFASIREIKERLTARKIIIPDYRLLEIFDTLRSAGKIVRDTSNVQITRYRLGDSQRIAPLEKISRSEYSKRQQVRGASKRKHRTVPDFMFVNKG